jgi:hypothetical protein
MRERITKFCGFPEDAARRVASKNPLVAVELLVRGGAGSWDLAVTLAHYISALAHVDACAQQVEGRVLLRLVVPATPPVSGADDEPLTMPRLRELDLRRHR